MILFNLCLSLSLLTLSGLSIPETKTNDTINIRISCEECIGKEIKISNFSMLRNKEEVLYRAAFGSFSTKGISLSVQDTLRLNLVVDSNADTRYGNDYFFSTSFYIEPDSTLGIQYKDSTLTYKGDLAMVAECH